MDNEKPPWLRYIACGSPFNRLPLLPSGPDGVGRRAIAQNLPSTPRGNDYGERGIRTLGARLELTPLPRVHLRPLGHLSKVVIRTISQSGERGIRTLGTEKRYNGFRIRLLRPLGHLSLRGPALCSQEDSNLRPPDPQSDALSS